MKNIFAIGILLGSQFLLAQKTFTRKDSLQGGLRLERTCFDIIRYDLNLSIDIENKFISGYNDISFRLINPNLKIQLDLFENMQVDSIILNSKKLNYKREFGAVFIDLPSNTPVNFLEKLRFYYSGNPVIAKRAPWNGGFVFKKDKNNNPWISVSCQGVGASLWYPCKDTQTDEPNFGASIKIAVPNGFTNVSNGRFLGSEDLKNGYTRWDWEVKNPINNYNITLNIGDYAHIHDNYKGLDLDYYVLSYNKEKTIKHFEEVKSTLDCFQEKFGEYPFKEDGYKLVETPYLGMEHQSAIAYGNNFQKGYNGYDLSMTGIGMNFDYVIVHETSHEWFGNSITSKDIADMWIHEAFAMYSESVYVECFYGYEMAKNYMNGMKRNVENDRPIIGTYGVNNEGSTDMYYKGALMLNTIRHIINDDKKWWSLLLNFSKTYKHQIIDTETVVHFFNKECKINLTPIFNQYLKYNKIPVFEYKINNDSIEYRWVSDETNFAMPIDIILNEGFSKRLHPTTYWKKINLNHQNFSNIKILTDNFYIFTNKI